MQLLTSVPLLPRRALKFTQIEEGDGRPPGPVWGGTWANGLPIQQDGWLMNVSRPDEPRYDGGDYFRMIAV